MKVTSVPPTSLTSVDVFGEDGALLAQSILVPDAIHEHAIELPASHRRPTFVLIRVDGEPAYAFRREGLSEVMIVDVPRPVRIRWPDAGSESEFVLVGVRSPLRFHVVRSTGGLPSRVPPGRYTAEVGSGDAARELSEVSLASGEYEFGRVNGVLGFRRVER